MDKFDKLLKGMGVTVGDTDSLIQKTENTNWEVAAVNTSGSRVGMVKSARERLFEQIGGVRERDIRKAYGDENIKDQHAESWHVDNDKLVHKMSTTASKNDPDSKVHDQDSQKEAASVVVSKPAKKTLGVTQATKSDAEKLLTEDELFVKAMGEMDAEDEGESDAPDEAEQEAVKEEKKNAPKLGERQEVDKSETKDALDFILKGMNYGMYGEKGAKKQIGRTASGKDIMDTHDHKAHEDFDHDDHEDAFRAHSSKMREHEGYRYDLMSGEPSAEKRKLQQGLKEKVAHCDEQRVKHLKKIYKSVNYKLISKLEKACAVDQSEDVDEKLKREAAKMSKLHENSPEVAEQKKPGDLVKEEGRKSELDELVDLVKSYVPNDHQRMVQTTVSAIQKSTPQAGFVKAAGNGGVVMDFGNGKTGNRFVDNANALLDRHGDPTQKYIAEHQSEEYEKALNEYVSSGEKTYMAKHNGPGAGVDLDTPMDKQVAMEFAKGQLQQTEAKKSFGSKEIDIAGERVVATSETDAALIEMMKAGNVDLSDAM